MENNNEEIPEGNDQPTNNQPWLARDALAIPGWLHHFPRHPEKLLPKFDPETSGFPKDHIKKFILAIRLMNVQHEDIVCRFSLTPSRTWLQHGILISQLDPLIVG
jgi:hypothetical protein